MERFSLKILTYNIHKGFNVGNTRFVLHEIKEALKFVDADVVFLQEIQGEHTKKRETVDRWPDESQFEFLADEVWEHHAYGKNAIYKSGHHGNAILCKYPFIEWDNINVSNRSYASRSLLHGTIQIPGSESRVHVICVHLGLLESEREEQIATLSERIDSHVPHDEPLIIAGDFNDWRGRAEMHFQTDLGLEEVFKTMTGRHARSFPIWRPFLRMDRIYFRGVEPVQCECLRSKPWRRLSDHTPLYSEFLVPASEAEVMPYYQKQSA